MKNYNYQEYGVTCNPAAEQKNQKVHVSYNGILAQQGADRVFAYVGYGSNTQWQDSEYHELQRTADYRFEGEFVVTHQDNLHMAFKDSADHWDNNNGQNYVFPVK